MERSKFNVDKDKEKRTYNNIVFDSQLEMKYYRDVLCPAVESGEVQSIHRRNENKQSDSANLLWDELPQQAT